MHDYSLVVAAKKVTGPASHLPSIEKNDGKPISRRRRPVAVQVDHLVTDRLVLRRWKPEDREPFADLNSDPEVMRYFPRPLTRLESDAFVDRIEDGFRENGFGWWAVEIDGRFAGFTGLNKTPYETPMGSHVEIGWRFATWAWGCGYATEAARCALGAAFGPLGLAVVYSFTTASNTKSEAVMQRIGMSRRPELDFDHPNTPGWWGARHFVYSVSW